MKIAIKGSPEEIAALVLNIQGRLGLAVENESSIKALAQAICDRPQGLQLQSDS